MEMSNITAEFLLKQKNKLKKSVRFPSSGTELSVIGLTNVMAGELVEFETAPTDGPKLREKRCWCHHFRGYEISEGEPVKRTGRILDVPERTH